MPKLWQASIEAHRGAVRDAVVDAAGALVAEHGLSALTMSAVAEAAGVSRATLYKYFADADALVGAWHRRQVEGHLAAVTEASGRRGPVGERIRGVLASYGAAVKRQHSGELALLLHRDEHVARAHQHLEQLLADLLAQGAAEGAVRDDVPPAELAAFCLHALSAAGAARSAAALGRLVDVAVRGLAPDR